jgi:DNA-binding MurR/RpiR family transcriptional regulator
MRFVGEELPPRSLAVSCRESPCAQGLHLLFLFDGERSSSKQSEPAVLLLRKEFIHLNMFRRSRRQQDERNQTELIRILEAEAAAIAAIKVRTAGFDAQKFAAVLCSRGRPAVFIHSAVAPHGDLGLLARNDVIVALSSSGIVK